MGEYGDQNTPKEVMLLLAKNTIDLRKEQGFTQKELSERSGVAYASVRKFETTGIISLESLLKICNALGRLEEFESLLLPDEMERMKKLFDY
ncbi:helix-turn-helix domain-containing protein [Brumimicrobium aurantiacum]|uniref:XRE family transcriptional regulator n=1 Tax=Brumimicrobium aurantiacum TaxID=1737063 RepID=A0A3E1EXC9_9FLAO|nr:helix-turn-helix transcriptional regulator [Brumimicrobium aurantiacum]RFC54178.1 XRE family transcriptional regulator [Brumimicrobium aurantiacum]